MFFDTIILEPTHILKPHPQLCNYMVANRDSIDHRICIEKDLLGGCVLFCEFVTSSEKEYYSAVYRK